MDGAPALGEPERGAQEPEAEVDDSTAPSAGACIRIPGAGWRSHAGALLYASACLQQHDPIRRLQRDALRARLHLAPGDGAQQAGFPFPRPGQVPTNASVSAQNALVPHLSQRQSIYLFPYAVGHADYILLDAIGSIYPFKDYQDYASKVKAALQHGDYGVVDMRDGYLLLKRGFLSSDITTALQMIDEDMHTD
jgi:hypothetical protein